MGMENMGEITPAMVDLAHRLSGGASSSAQQPAAAAADDSVSEPTIEPRNRGRPPNPLRRHTTPEPKVARTIVKSTSKAKAKETATYDSPPPLPESFSVDDEDLVAKPKERSKQASSEISPHKAASKKKG